MFTRAGSGDDEDLRQPNVARTIRGRGPNNNRNSAYNPITPGGSQGGTGHPNRRNRNRNSKPRNAGAPAIETVRHPAGQGQSRDDRFRGQNRQQEERGEPERKKKFDGPVFGYKRLFRFLSEPHDDVITMIWRNVKDWEELLDQDSISCVKQLRNGRTEQSDDLLYIIVELLGEKVCSSTTVLGTYQNTIISATVGSQNFLRKLDDKVRSYMMDGFAVNDLRHGRPTTEFDVVQNPASLFQNLIKFIRFTTGKMQSAALDFLQIVSLSVLSSLMYINGSTPSTEVADLLKQAHELMEIIKGIKKDKERQIVAEEVKSGRRGFRLTEAEEAILDTLPPPDDYKDIPIVPSVDEIRTNEEPFLRRNKTSGAYDDAHHYLDVQFRLLREDFVRPLKIGVCDYLTNKADFLTKRKRPPVGNVRLYPQVTYADIKLERGTVVHYMKLHPDNYKKVKWDKCKRLLTGTLLVFTTDDFETAYFGVVHQRNEVELKTGKLAITWEGDSPEFDKQAKFLMVECEVYFEAYRYTLQVLKEIQLQHFPMAKFIVEASSDVRPPAYLQENTHLLEVGNYSCSPLLDHTWPDAKDLGLDQKQFEAYKACLTKEFAIVQGPPGTGKTFLALQVVEVFLRNLQVWNSGGAGGPILVVCYTNHALDQFLQGCLKVFEKLNSSPKIVRVGGRSKTTELEEFSLNRQRNVHQKLHQDPHYSRMKSEAHRAVRMAESVRQNALAEFSALTKADGIILFEKLRIYDELTEEIPEWILQLVNNPEWFALDDATVQHFDVQELRRWFQINSQASEAHANGRQTKATGQIQPDSSDSEGEEDYDVEELEQNRIVDAGYADIEAVAPKATDLSLSLLFDARKRLLQEQLGEVESRRQKMKAEETASLNSKMRSLENQTELLKKKEAICKAVITAYRKKTLHVKDAQGYFRDAGVQLRHPPPQVATRWFIYFHILEKAKVIAAARVRKSSEDMSNAQKGWQEVLRMGDGRIISRSLIVGMTTTGAAKYNDLLRMTRSRIVLVEEAAEVLESHIVTCITPACQHLILIGDHQQLRPSTTVYELAKNYQLDISLFERMVNNKLNCYKINVQHRMRPEIADLVVGTIYPELHNAPRVYQYPRVVGVTSDLFFIDHKFKESAVGDSKSKSNDHEAKFMAALCRYLIQNGYGPDRITILTTYIGQMFLIKQCLKNLQTCQGVRVTCVDNFQGEENDIILLSLVRSNDKGNIGFLKTDNRICVAISRAKQGLFIIGNMSQLETAGTWKKIKAKLANGRRVGTSLIIQCEVHGTQQLVSDDKDFSRLAPEGGCNQECAAPLDCGHICKSVCHIEDRDHIVYKCKERCVEFCRRNHQCLAECFRSCPPCRVPVTKLLECGHSARVNCHEYENDFTCSVVVDKILPCGHEEKLACYVDQFDYTCKRKVLKDLPCGHKKEVECHIGVSKITCGEMVDKQLPCGHTQKDKCWRQVDTISCDTTIELVFDLCGHKATVKCSMSKDPNVKCKSPCNSRLECGHACTLICHKDVDPYHTQYTCKKDCGRVCENGHRCKSKHQCYKSCPPCRTSVEKRLPCAHKMKMPCFQDAADENCQAPCTAQLDCGHSCIKKCFEPCGPCEELVTKVSPGCGHQQEMRCSEDYTRDKCNVHCLPDRYSSCGHDNHVPCRLADLDPQQLSELCQEECGYQFDSEGSGCDHRCQGTCGGCQEGRLHVKCQQNCGKQLVCGHTCNFPCSKSCPPCQQPCLMECEHSKCEAKCGEPCSGCVERCGWKCQHKRCTKLCSERCDRDPCNEPCPKKLGCGHDCIGFCGEPCPPQCRMCNREELTEFILYGFEDDEDARFVLLEGCGHAIEVNGLDHFMGLETDEGEITPRCCPRCKSLITKSRRYGNILRTRLEDIMKVKNHKFGSLKDIQPQVFALANAVHSSTDMNLSMKAYLTAKLIRGLNKKQQLLCNKIDKATLVSLDIIFKLVKEAAANLDDKSSSYVDPIKRRTFKADLANRYDRLFKSLRGRQLPLSKQELEDFEWEFARMHDLNQMYHIQASTKFSPGHVRASPICIMLNRTINERGRYNERRQAHVQAYLKELDKVLATGLGITDRERLDILKAFNMREGHWFKCPNGHVYVITECGGAMEEGNCNECGAPIGGGSHRLRSDNALASEMDGARAPLYPTTVW